MFAFLAEPANIRHWLLQLRRDDAPVPDAGLRPERAAWRIAWACAPAGAWRIAPAGDLATLVLALAQSDRTETGRNSEDVAHAAQAALQSVKSHVEGVDGGDPDLPGPDLPSRLYGHTATQEPEV